MLLIYECIYKFCSYLYRYINNYGYIHYKSMQYKYISTSHIQHVSGHLSPPLEFDLSECWAFVCFMHHWTPSI